MAFQWMSVIGHSWNARGSKSKSQWHITCHVFSFTVGHKILQTTPPPFLQCCCERCWRRQRRREQIGNCCQRQLNSCWMAMNEENSQWTT
jgi:hypothetical protein